VPNVINAAGYESYIEIVFDKYMDTDTLNNSAITLSGYTDGYGITFPDAEPDPENPAKLYARFARIEPSGGAFTMGGTFGLTIQTDAQCYAGVGLNAVYRSDITIVPEPKGISLPGKITMDYGEVRTFYVPVSPEGIGANRKITASSNSPIVLVDSESNTNHNGIAAFTITGDLPGMANVTFALENTTVKGAMTVEVGMPGENVSDNNNGGSGNGGNNGNGLNDGGNGDTGNSGNRTGIGSGIGSGTGALLAARQSQAQPPAVPSGMPDAGEKPFVNPFSDVTEDDWFYNDIAYVYANNIMLGTSGNTFSPGMKVQRGMLVTMLSRIADIDLSGYSQSSFDDVEQGNYYTSAVEWARDAGLVKGIGNNKFAPEEYISRQDLAVILNNFADYMGWELPVTRQYTGFNDDMNMAGYARTAVERLYNGLIISGKPGNIFDPENPATRAEGAALLHRFLESVK
jgi:hypothetical protein